LWIFHYKPSIVGISQTQYYHTLYYITYNCTIIIFHPLLGTSFLTNDLENPEKTIEALWSFLT
jgi:hypothetical protein